MKQKGFTLLEVMIVVAILIILSSIVFTEIGKMKECNKAENSPFQEQTLCE